MKVSDSSPRFRKAEESRNWQARRAQLLRDACIGVAHELGHGVRIGRAIKLVARKFRGRSLGRSRKLALSEKSLTRHWYSWIGERGDETFNCRYISRPRPAIDPFLLRLIVYSAIRESKQVSEILASVLTEARTTDHPSLRTIQDSLPAAAIRRYIQAERRLLRKRSGIEKRLLAIDSQLRELRKTGEREFLKK